jgi:hypothetical protein
MPFPYDNFRVGKRHCRLLFRAVWLIHFPTNQKILSQSNEDYGETKDMTREELLQLIDKTADEVQTELRYCSTLSILLLIN